MRADDAPETFNTHCLLVSFTNPVQEHSSGLNGCAQTSSRSPATDERGSGVTAAATSCASHCSQTPHSVEWKASDGARLRAWR